MPVEPRQGDALKDYLKSLPADYTFGNWIRSTASLQSIAFGTDPRLLAGGGRADFIRWNTLAAVAELMEFLEETPWKPWASSQKLDREAAIGELVDVMHFLGNLIRTLDVTGEELTTAYRKKQLKNLQRQIDGYDGKREKCAYCNRELDGIDGLAYVEGEGLLKVCNVHHYNLWKEKND